MMKKLCLILTLLYCLTLWGCGKPADGATTESTHRHTFGDWFVKKKATCTQEGLEKRLCSECYEAESRPLARLEHKMGANNTCEECHYVDVDDDVEFVELGVVCDEKYGEGVLANYAWDVKIWDGKLYRASGDYGKNSGPVVIYAYDIATRMWELSGSALDEAVHSFEEINGTLVAPGIDPTSGWQLGNYYVLKDGGWKQVRNLPNGIHNFDMVEADGRIFAGLGTESVGDTVAVSEDGGETFRFVPLYQDGKPYDTSDCSSSRTYEFIKYNGDVYALVRFELNIGGKSVLFRYEDGKMVYVGNGYKLIGGSTVGRKYINGEFEFNGVCYLTASKLYAITDFADVNHYKVIEMPGRETVADALVKDGVIYVMAYKSVIDPHTHKRTGYKTVIYKSTTGEAGSFEELISFEYAACPCAFDYDGKHFYIGTTASVEKAKTGMILRVKPAA